MRVAVMLVAIAACTPEISNGAYLCGLDSSCPSGQQCNGPDNTCVDDSVVQAFACDPTVLHEPDNDLAHAVQLPALACVSAPATQQGCLAAGDSENWVAFDVPASCTSVEVEARITFPIGFEGLSLEVTDSNSASLGTDVECKNVPDPEVSGEGQRCVAIPVTPGGHFGIRTAPSGTDDCDGNCNFNRYLLTVQLATPG